MATPRFDVIDITQTIRRHRRFILVVTLVAMALGVVFSLIRKKKYKAQTEFFLSNPLYADRNYLFRSHDMHFVDYFAGDDDIDKIIVNAESDQVKDKVIENMKLAEAYKIDMSNPEQRSKLKDVFNLNSKIKRSEYRHLILTYVDTDPKRAADVANEHVRVTEEVFRAYYNTIKGYAYTSINDKIKEMDSSIAALTDTLSGLRDQYKIYDIISPSRSTTTTATISSNGTAAFGRGVEQIQNISSVKDQLVIDRAKYISLLNEFSTGTKDNEIKFIQVSSPATPPTDQSGPGMLVTVLTCALLGLFFSILYQLLTTYYKILISVERD
ncbi:MAG: hypothetical protein EOP51_04380 [Sphingobacteriales bacterium]|nr:MAG: hypothetical protein EOP51_04380 [Sphingobacteriales bacterium]